MAIAPEFVHDIFRGLENAPPKRAFIAGTFDKLAKVLPQGAQLHVDYLMADDSDQSHADQAHNADKGTARGRV